MKNVRIRVKVQGIVQGVGFRPFIYNLARRYKLVGWVNNSSQGVIIDVEGKDESIDSFLSAIKLSPPPLAKIDSIEFIDLALAEYKDFVIKESLANKEKLTLLSPDIATCSDCMEEIKDRNNRRYGYSFANCTNCGPRYSIIEALPYDRKVTTMKSFKMCEQCRTEYENPKDRRFHAQPNACPECGPQLCLTDNLGRKLAMKDPLKQAIQLLQAGKIIAIKGLGGFHLVCDGKNQVAIEELRVRKRRPDKPFALMMRGIEVVKKYCYLNSKEEEILTGIRRPILLLERKNNHLPPNISKDNNYLGVMLPYTPLHQLLFDDGLEVLVMTSANVSGLAIEYTNQGAINRLEDVVDYLLLHNRKIHIPIDDSVARVLLGQEILLRRARGYAPLAIKFSGLKETLACGSQLKNSFALAKGDYIFLSQHLGNINHLESYHNYQRIINHLKELYQVNPELIAYDLHPEYLTSQFAQNQGGQKIAVQHHHAHIVSCMVENEVSEQVIGLTFDGTGLGRDAKLWGGEFLICDYSNFKRVGQLKYVKLPSGEQAIKEPWRMAISYLYHAYGDDRELFTELIGVKEEKIKEVVNLIKADINSPKTSSMGRFFAGVASLLGLVNSISYEAQGAIKLETMATNKEVGEYNYQVKSEGSYYIVDTTSIIKVIVEDIKLGVSKGVIARKFHNTVISFSVEICKLIRSDYKINLVALSGGVFQNQILLKGIYQKLVAEGFKVYFHKQIPCNDGGLAVGHLVIANYQKGVEDDVYSDTSRGN